jgi:uncharacterized protein (TIGR02246 family)
MSSEIPSLSSSKQISMLYHRLLDAWNMHDAAFFAAQFEDEGNCIGFDGSQLDGREAIEAEISQIFAIHETGSYVVKIREIRFLTPETAVLRAIAGMVPPGRSDIDQEVNAIQSLVAVRRGDRWRIALFQNTPAQFHGRPELSEALTSELREEIKKENEK